MPLTGKPGIERLRGLELRQLQGVIDGIRQRLGALDAEVNRVSSIADASSATNLVNALQTQVRQLTARVSSIEQAVGLGDAVEILAGEAVAQFDPIVMVSPLACGPADFNDPTRITGLVGLATAAAATGQAVPIQRRGSLSVPSANFEPLRPVYAGLGGLTQFPTYGDFVVLVGVATSSTSIWIAPAPGPYLQNPGLYGSEYDDFLPVTWGLIRERFQLLDSLLLQPDGFVVKTGDALVTRQLVVASGSALEIDNPDGVGGDPVFTTP